MNDYKTKKNALIGMLIALAFIFSYIESLIPFNFGVPGIKLGLANIVVLTALYVLGVKEAFILSIIRIILTGLTFTSLAAMLYSLAGGLLSFLLMMIAKKTDKFSIMGVSVLGGIGHNTGQIIMAILVLNTAGLIYYLPLLIISGLVTGTIIGIIGGMVVERVKNYGLNKE
ncbi:heptaprenyl diphosphate synthase [Acetitomaculum ruminis DSM 5522]|uniref:Heptaprenyl diphosphate synthase n=1 Tax=Acetitomaculum ruminis DSM 5522 TaxID=1120918 RepID=A0A1I1A4U3_9FIRM|nr:Gx transporter family protein [Acetitomaculum ruminis]SFB33044.1 heptaprenyl diphosphate synthase [Acetitomaculum ruminis DSM 5522]